jgi:hypothetical protein
MATKTAPKVKVTAKQLAVHREKASRDHSPKWEGNEFLSAEEFSKQFRVAMKYYNMEHSYKDLKTGVLTWMSTAGYTKLQQATFKRTKDWRCTLTMGAIAACLLRGMPPVREDFNKGRSTAQWLGNEISKTIENGKHDIDEEAIRLANIESGSKATAAGPTIQDRVRELAMTMTAEIEDSIEKWETNAETFDPKEFKMLNLLKGKGAKAAHARIIREFYARPLAELELLSSGKADEQLKEGYSHRPRKHIKKFIDFLREIQTACTMLMEEAKLTRKVKAPKAVSKDKLIAKLKYKKTDEPLKLVSINPTDVIGAKELWIFNSKTRKLGKYIAAEPGELGVKGTTITGYDENKSIQKTLRKPVDQLKDFKAAGKVALRKFLEDINAVDTKMNGRISEDIMLLRVV